jgi:hypothetical protein
VAKGEDLEHDDIFRRGRSAARSPAP